MADGYRMCNRHHGQNSGCPHVNREFRPVLEAWICYDCGKFQTSGGPWRAVPESPHAPWARQYDHPVPPDTYTGWYSAYERTGSRYALERMLGHVDLERDEVRPGPLGLPEPQPRAIVSSRRQLWRIPVAALAFALAITCLFLGLAAGPFQSALACGFMTFLGLGMLTTLGVSRDH